MVLGQLLEGASNLLSGINDDDIGDTAALNAATNRCKGYKTAFKNKLRAAQASTKALAASPSAFNREYAQQAFEKFEDAYNTVCAGYARTITLCNGDKTVTTTMETKVQEVSDDFDKAQADFFKAMDKSEPAPQATPTMAAQTTGRLPAYRTHYNAALKPFTLELEHTPADLRTWKERMHAYFASNELEQASFVEQNQYVLQCVSMDKREAPPLHLIPSSYPPSMEVPRSKTRRYMDYISLYYLSIDVDRKKSLHRLTSYSLDS